MPEALIPHAERSANACDDSAVSVHLEAARQTARPEMLATQRLGTNDLQGQWVKQTEHGCHESSSYMAVGENQWDAVLGGIGMFTGGTIWILTHGHICHICEFHSGIDLLPSRCEFPGEDIGSS